MSNNNHSKIIWFTGMSGSGKSYYSDCIKEILKKENLKINVIDGDVIRDKYKIPVGFKYDEICNNNKNIAKICKNEYKKYDLTIVSVISPYESIRQEIKKKFKNVLFYIYVYADIESLRKRDTKGLYKKADMGLIDDMIGYSEKSLYEEPENADLKLNTSSNIQPKQNIELLSNFIYSKIL
jgi:adenylyl-sulfate kinase